MNIDLHNHTPLCNHAEGSIEDFVKKAIECKIDYFGFSDHAPMEFDPKYRMRFNQMGLYEKSVLHVKEKYKDDITVLLAYEVDFLKGYIDDRVLQREVDYFIGSVHFLGEWGFDNPEFIGKYKNKNIDTIWQEYFEAIEALANSKLFHILGHIDLIKVFNFLPKKDIRTLAQNAIKAIKNSGMCVELNAAGLRKPVSEIYPSRSIMELLAEYDIPVTLSSDAHSPEQINYKKDALKAFAREYGYTQCAVFQNKERFMVKI